VAGAGHESAGAVNSSGCVGIRKKKKGEFLS